METIEILRQYWQYNSFRPLQEEIIQSVMDGKDTLALLPTGGGKSLCFQVPAMAKPGICLVVSPLIALMKDQTEQLRRKNITAFALYAGMSRKDVINTLQVVTSSNCKFLYVSPERLESDLFSEWLPSLPISLLAVDEAHCVSQWGYDFRPSYLRIASIREETRAPLLALTASATPEVLDDIQLRLGMKDTAVFRGSFTRPNLSYSHFTVDKPITKITEILQKVPGSGIVYCKTRRATRDIADQLIRMGFTAGAYHAGLTHEERSKAQDAWLKDQLRVIVSTNAFGMGIDKPGVRTVIHTDPPESPEAYYQEAGRAGRDGNKAYAVLLSQASDPARLEQMPETRFPPVEKIRPVYQDLMNYLQLPVASGEKSYFDFDVNKFTDVFNLDMTTAMTMLKVVEGEGLLSFLQQVSLPARLRFITNKENLYDFEDSHEELQPLIEILLRTYEGIFDRPVSIREKHLAWLLRKEPAQIIADIQRLQAFGIVDYTPRKDEPQLYFLRDRPAAEDFYIDPLGYRLRKEQYAARVHAMVRYLGLTEQCRSRFLAHYFGDKEAKDCGICDNCLKRAGKGNSDTRPGPGLRPPVGPARRPR